MVSHTFQLWLYLFTGWTVLHQAAHDGHNDLVRILLNAGADVNLTNIDKLSPFHLAAKNGWSQVAETLITANADLESASYLSKCSQFSHTHVDMHKTGRGSGSVCHVLQ